MLVVVSAEVLGLDWSLIGMLDFEKLWILDINGLELSWSKK